MDCLLTDTYALKPPHWISDSFTMALKCSWSLQLSWLNHNKAMTHNDRPGILQGHGKGNLLFIFLWTIRPLAVQWLKLKNWMKELIEGCVKRQYCLGLMAIQSIGFQFFDITARQSSPRKNGWSEDASIVNRTEIPMLLVAGFSSVLFAKQTFSMSTV